jgi:hypothetical protein
MTDYDLSNVVEKVVESVREAANEPLDAGAAELTTSSVKELYGADAVYDAPAVVLTPRNPTAARLIVEVQAEDLWWLSAGDGPPFEFAVGMREDRYSLLKRLVHAVVSGQYEYGWEHRHRRLLLRPWRRRTVRVWVATFGPDGHPVTTEHWADPRGKDPARRSFAAYMPMQFAP